VRAGLAAAAEEASTVVVRSSHSTFIQEGADACAALLDPTGQLVAQSTSTSLMHSCSLRCAVPELVAAFPLGELRPGDVLATNDPYKGGIHANDVLIVEPVFAGGEVRFFAGTLIHVADLGGAVAGGLAAVATDVFHEGIVLPPVKLHAGGQPVAAVWAILAANSRAPDKVLGDIRALVSGARTLARRVEELCDWWGADTISTVAAEWIDYAERRMRQELAALPDGTWTGSYDIETDGVEPGREFTVEVTATITGDSCVLDFTGTSPQARGAINSSVSQTLSGALYAARCFVDAAIPMNEGCLRPLDVRLSEGSLVNPAPPAACGGRIVTVAAVIEAIVEALAGARPELAVAASGLVHVYTLAGRGDGESWVTLLYEFGGLGARVGSDGPDATGAYFLGGRSVVPQIEPLEAAYPLLVRRAALRPDSGGAGRWRGGRGLEQIIEVTEPAVATVRGDRIQTPPAGRAGGSTGAPGSFAVRRRGGTVEQLAPKQANVALDAGDALIVATSGGGGLGSSDAGESDGGESEDGR
jgi:N-methylhydantoinase B